MNYTHNEFMLLLYDVTEKAKILYPRKDNDQLLEAIQEDLSYAWEEFNE